MEPNLITKLAILESQLNEVIDQLIKLRDGSLLSVEKNIYRNACRKIEVALTKVHDVQEIIVELRVDR